VFIDETPLEKEFPPQAREDHHPQTLLTFFLSFLLFLFLLSQQSNKLGWLIKNKNKNKSVLLVCVMCVCNE